MKILVINCGSSSLKYQLIDSETEDVLAKGLCERIGIEGSNLKHTPGQKESVVINEPMNDHTAAVKTVIDALLDPAYGVIKSIDEISAVGHRVVHGGEAFSGSVIITDDVIKAIEDCSDLAPLHNPPNLIGINACKKLMPTTKMVAVFDTAFHLTMPKEAYMYALPYEFYENYKIRKYGFHGTSHKYVSERAAVMLNKKAEDTKIITCHLGNGASICAVKGGKSVDTSMGFTPLEGLIMGTRSGDIDPAIIFYLMRQKNMSFDEIDDALNKRSGVLGLSGISSDFRDIEEAAAAGNERAKTAIDVFCLRVAKYVGSYAAAMNGADAVVFTAGLGENGASVREKICAYLSYLGLELNKEANEVRGKEIDIATADSKVRVFVIPTNEELVIARDTKDLLDKQ